MKEILRLNTRLLAAAICGGLVAAAQQTGAPAEAGSVLGTGRGLDHVLIVVRDLQEAARTYADALGFNVTPGGAFPGSFRNSIVRFRGDYLELISVDRSKVRPDEELARLLEKREGGYAFALNVSSAQQTADALRARKVDVVGPQGSSYTPEGSNAVQTALWQTVSMRDDVAFRPMFFIQYAREGGGKAPEHPNTAVALGAVWIAVKDLAAATRVYEAMGLRAGGKLQTPALGATGRRIEAGQGAVALLQPNNAKGPCASYIARYGEGVIGVSIKVRDLDAARSRIRAGTKKQLDSYDGPFGRSILVTPQFTHGMWIEFFR